VSQLVAEQFPQWSQLPVRPVDLNGWDNTTFRLGSGLAVRLPSADAYVAQVDKEQRWLPILASQLPLAIPEPVAKGVPSRLFPRPWSIYRWLEGEPAVDGRIADLTGFAADLAGFLGALQRIDVADGPVAGEHNFFRGGPLAIYDGETTAAIAALAHDVDAAAAGDVWRAALATTWEHTPVWVHGDVAPPNLLVTDGRLNAVIDFGCCAVGDPACDLTIAWTLLFGESLTRFRRALPLDDGTWARARGWAPVESPHHPRPRHERRG
jgi:aminoglycoside phosphotransferase (APT) family kinase protein